MQISKLVNMNTDAENTLKQFATCLEYQHTQLKEKAITHEFPTKQWRIVWADIFSINKETFLCIVDYYSKFPVMKRTDGYQQMS